MTGYPPITKLAGFTQERRPQIREYVYTQPLRFIQKTRKYRQSQASRFKK